VATRTSFSPRPPGYVLELLREGAEFALYRGRQHGNPSPILAIVLSAEQPSPQSLRRLEHEYSLAATLDPAWAATPLALTREAGRTILILKDPGGQPLDRILEQYHAQPVDLSRFLHVAINLAVALSQLHRHGLIHKDMKPANVLVNEAGQVWLTGFGIASQLSHERQSPLPPEIIAGTLAYMAPEQTGRMNRSIDARSDLYALGVIFYEMLTGALPFAAADPLELVHCHVARQPISPEERAAVPAPLSAITMKLLAKNAEQRYQTASGLEVDLRKCLAEWQAHGRVDPFALGAHDLAERLLIPEKLYGREREIDALFAAFDQVAAQGTPELVLVSGYSGIGKSSVVNELHKALVPKRGFFAGGKFDQYNRDIPYATLTQAFQNLVRQILVKSEAQVEQWRHTLLEAVGPNGQLIVSLIPELEFIIGKQPPVPDLPPKYAQNRLQLVFRRFLCAFARPEHPLALFLDDLQWVDASTLAFIERLVTHPKVRHLLLVGAYRDNEVNPSHPILRSLEEIRKAKARVREIVLAPLDLEDVSAFAADGLNCEREQVQALAQLMVEKTGGNPFFMIQFFTALAEEGLLSFDSVRRAWKWDIDRIRTKHYTDNIVDLMSGKLRRLSAPTQEALKHLACLGRVADVATLALVRGETEETIHAALWEAVRAGLVFNHLSIYKFLHDRIQQAAYLLIPEEQRARLHLRIGKVMLASITADQLAQNPFDVANQLNRGAALMLDRYDKAQLATINLQSGRKAKASAAYTSAHAYFSAGMALLDERDWNRHYELTFSLWLERAECEFLMANFDDAERLIDELLRRRVTKLDHAAVYHLKVQLHEVKGEYPQAVASALTCLKQFDINIPAHPTKEQVQAEYEAVWEKLNGRPIESLVDLPLMTDLEMQAAMRVLSVVSPPAYLTDFRLCCFLACCMVKVGMQHGTSGASALALGYFGSFLGPVFHRYTDGYRFAKLACDLVEKHGFIAYQAKTYHTMGTVTPWTQPISSAIDFMRATFRTAIETGDLTYACYGMTPCIAGLLLRNDPLDAVWRESEMALEFTRGAKYGDVADIIRSQQRFIANMQGRTTTFSTFSDGQFDEATFEAQLTGNRMALMIFWYWMLKLKARFLSGDYAEALAAAGKVKVLLWTSVAQIQQLDYFYYAALAVAACYENASADQQQGWRELLTLHRERLREWAETYPPTFRDKHALVSAEIARLERRELDAMHLYEQAIQAARESGFVQNEALSHELAARFYLVRGFETVGRSYLRNARNCYDRWGALGKVKQLDDLYPQLHEERVATSITTIGTSVKQLDVETIVKASQALSSEIVLPELIEKLMRIVVEHAGADRGLLILLTGDEPRIAAETTTGHTRAEVTVREEDITPSVLPLSVLHYVIRTRGRVLLDDASVGDLYSDDWYVRQKHARSVLCLPILNQTKLIGALYLENNLTPGAFTSDRVAVLELLASQAAISLENAKLYTDLHRNEASLRESEKTLRLLVDGIAGLIAIMTPEGEVAFVNNQTLEYFGKTLEGLKGWGTSDAVHPDDLPQAAAAWRHSVETGDPYDVDHRLRRADGAYRWFHSRGLALCDAKGHIVRWYNLLTDIDDRRRAEEKLRRNEAYLSEAQKLSQTGSFGWDVLSGEISWSDETFRIFEYDRAIKPTLELVLERIHPEDKDFVQQAIEHAINEKTDFDMEHRLRMPDGSVKHVHAIARASKTSSDNLEFVGAVTDVTAAKQAEEKIRRSEMELRQILDFTPQYLAVLGPDHDRTRLYTNQTMLDYFGFTLEEWRSTDRHKYYHPDDWERLTSETKTKFLSGIPHEYEARFRRKDGQYRWFLFRWSPLRDEQGRVTRWYAAATDIEERKQAEQRLENENVALREEIARASMFEEIVGVSPALHAVLSRVSKVAPTDSTILITGETGTGKELIARAVHRRSQRCSRAFVGVNCAAVPRDLIASELFGHEKGAFTGATQRRLGRFELAEGGTIFLDEIGELPAETQIALLRVLQEHEFERVGGTGSIRTNVRVIAATNRDLQAAIDAGTFRSDLFYRLNVFPIEVPPLRERQEDIPVLVGYFIDRYARKAGKSVRGVNRRSLELLQSYPWPGNIRELQNVIERSVIVCDAENLSVDASWLSWRPHATGSKSHVGLSRKAAAEEKEIIEAALRESGGRVSGPSGAAAKLGIPGSTLESKIRSLKINKHRFKTTDPSVNRF
jgi:PAS domain S-box-containing protein